MRKLFAVLLVGVTVLAFAATVDAGDRNLVALGDAELNEVRQSMAVVLQGTLPFTCGLFFSLTVYENVAFALRQRNRWS